MVDLLDSLILKIFDTQWTAAPPPAKPHFSFATPDENFLAHLADDKPTLDIFLAEVRENRDMRRSQWDDVPQPDGSFIPSMPPGYFDFLYLITAWSTAEESPMTSPAAEEHQLLGEALRVLLRNPDVVPAALGIGGGPVFRNAHVYFTVGAPEAPRVAADLWTTMKLPWKASITLMATAPVDPLLEAAGGPAVITFVQRYGGIGAAPGTFEELIQIGGTVVDAVGGAPIPEATVVRVATGEEATTDSQGRFTFAGLSRGTHTFRASKAGMISDEHDVTVPDGPAGEHVFKLS